MSDLSQVSTEDLIAYKQGNLQAVSTEGLLAIKGSKPAAPTQPTTQKPPIGRTVFDQAMQGATFGFADEISDRLGAAGASILTGDKYSDLLNQARQESQPRLQQEMTQRPAVSIASNIAGGIASAAPIAATAPAKMLGQAVQSGGALTKVGAGVAGGALGGGLYGAGSAPEGQRTQGAQTGAMYGAMIGGAVPAVGGLANLAYKGGGAITKGLAARTANELDEAANAIKEGSSGLYQQMRESGTVINKPRGINIANQIKGSIQESGKLNVRLHGDTLSVLDDLKTAAQKGSLGLEELDQYRQLLGDVISKNTDAIKGANPDARLASIAIDKLDDLVDGLKPIDIVGGKTDAVGALKQGREEWARFRKFQTVSNLIKKSSGDANKLESEFKRFIQKPRNLRGFTKDEIAIAKSIANPSTSSQIMKGLGRFGIDANNVFLPLVGGGLGALGGAATPAGGLIAAGTLARHGRNIGSRAKPEELLRVIETTK